MPLSEGRLVCHRPACLAKASNIKLANARRLGLDRSVAPIPVGTTVHRVPILGTKVA